jgi:hypothetical protein
MALSRAEIAYLNMSQREDDGHRRAALLAPAVSVLLVTTATMMRALHVQQVLPTHSSVTRCHCIHDSAKPCSDLTREFKSALLKLPERAGTAKPPKTTRCSRCDSGSFPSEAGDACISCHASHLVGGNESFLVYMNPGVDCTWVCESMLTTDSGSHARVCDEVVCSVFEASVPTARDLLLVL